MLVVSHDRYFLNRVCNCVIVFEKDKVVTSVGDYDYYLSRRDILNTPEEKVPEPEKKPIQIRPRSAAKKLSYAEQRELDGMEEAIANAEAKVEELETAFCDPELFAKRPKDVPALQAELEAAKESLEKLYARWEELENKKAALENA